MRRVPVLPIVLAALLVSSVAFAAANRVSATFESLAASGIQGGADLNSVAGGTNIHESIRGLTPGVVYASFIYQGNTTCASGSPLTQVMQFTANPQGIATVNAKVSVDLTQIGSVSIQRVSDNTLLACASVTP
jgi:hypothetical protein